MESLFPRNAIDINYGDMKNIPNKPADEDFVGSFRRDLIKDITDIVCAGCVSDEKLMGRCKDDNSPPMTGLCGHLFCYECAKLKHNTFLNQTFPSSDEMDESRIASLEFKHNGEWRITRMGEVVLDIYKCEKCPDGRARIPKDKVEKFWEGDKTRTHPFVKLFEVNYMLKKLYEVLRTSGFRCKYRKENGLEICPFKHPLNNSLRCGPCCSLNEDNIFTCVWHAEGHMMCGNRRGGVDGLEIMASSLKLKDSKPDEFYVDDASVNYLTSLDRGNRIIYAALYHCARCGKSLEKDKAGVWEYLFSWSTPSHHCYLKCGHFVGAKCMPIARQEMLNGGVYCIFCKDILKVENNVMPTFTTCQALVDVVRNDPDPVLRGGGLRKCDFQCTDSNCDFKACKTQFPNRHNIYGNPKYQICQWCEVEHRLLWGEGKCSFEPEYFVPI